MHLAQWHQLAVNVLLKITKSPHKIKIRSNQIESDRIRSNQIESDRIRYPQFRLGGILRILHLPLAAAKEEAPEVGDRKKTFSQKHAGSRWLSDDYQMIIKMIKSSNNLQKSSKYLAANFRHAQHSYRNLSHLAGDKSRFSKCKKS